MALSFPLATNQANTERSKPYSFATKVNIPAPKLDKQKNNYIEKKKPLLMIADDEKGIREYLIGILEEQYNIIIAKDGQEALALAKAEQPDLIILDLMLPKIDGLEVCKSIKSEENLKMAKVILLTARADEDSKIIALKNGADDFLTKPFSTTELKTRIHNLFLSFSLQKEALVRNSKLQESLEKLSKAETQLIMSEKMRGLGYMAAGILHEINNPLNYMNAAINILKHNLNDKTNNCKELIGDIEEGVQRIQAVISNLNIFATQSEIKMSYFSIREMIDRSIRFIEQERSNIAITVSLPEEDIVYGSSGSIIQLIINILTNAIHAIKKVNAEGEGKITITGTQSSSSKRLMITIEDNGEGIRKEDIDKISEIFYTTKEAGEGMGLGLSICQTIINNHNGKIVIKSQYGKGTRLTFDLATKNLNGSQND